MDNSKWKALLLDWIGHTRLISPNVEKPENRLEDTNIRNFFIAFRKLLEITEFAPAQITDFLNVHYPDFELNSTSGDIDDDASNLSRSDYVFVYSMFLHYGCVIRFNRDIQRASQSLSASEQLAVTVFLNFFLSRNVIVTRPALSAAIREAIHSLDAGPLAKFYAEDENGNRGETFTTPKTMKLEQNSREIFRLRGQVDTVGFEMGYLEGLVREKDAQIENMKRNEGDLQREIVELKKTLMYGGGGYDDELRSEELARKERLELKTLRKNNAMLEDKVANLLIELNHVVDDKSKMIVKLKATAKDLKSFKERSAELSTLIEELNGEIAAKNKEINNLLETNMELEAFITENRSLLNKNIESMNTSSLSTSPNTSSSSLRAANLGSCVIDIQLKEKELENAALVAKINSLNDTSLGIRSGLEKFLEENAELREKMQETRLMDEPEKIPEFFQALTRILREKVQLESTIQGQITVMLKFREERDRLKEELATQVDKSSAMEKELVALRETVRTYAETERRELDTFKYEVKHLNDLMTMQKLEKESFKSAIEKGEEDLYAKIKKIGKLNLVIERLRFEKKKAENEQKELETNLNRMWGIKVEEGRMRQLELERKVVDQENVLALRQKHIDLLEEKQQQMADRVEEMRRNREESERRWTEREESCRRELNRLQEMVEKMEAEATMLKKDNASLETKIRIVSNNLRPSLSLDVDKMRGLELGSEADAEIGRARRSSLRNQMTSTPRLSMKQKVRMDVELLKRRRISLLSPDGENDDGGLTSSESDNACLCNPQSAEEEQRAKQKVRVARRDSLIFNSPCRKRRTSYARANNPSKAIFDRSAINRMQKLKRQKIFNKARGSLKEVDSEGGGTGGSKLDSLLWDGEYDLMDLEGNDEEFALNLCNNEERQTNFHEILETERCDGVDLFGDEEEITTPKSEEIGTKSNEKRDGDGNKIISARQSPREAVVTPMTRSFDRSAGGGSMQNKSYSMNSGVFLGNERIPTMGVVHFSPRSERVTISPFRNRMRKWDLRLIPLSQQNLLQLIAVVLIGIFVCVFYQNVVY